MRYKVHATYQELRTPGGSKGGREWELPCALLCTVHAEGIEGGGGQRDRRPETLQPGTSAGQGKRGRADRGQDRARGPGQRGGQRGSAASRIAPHCAPASRRAEGQRWQGREGGNMVPHN